LIALTVLTLASPLSMMTTSTHFRHYHGTSFMLVDSCVIAPTTTTWTMDISSMGTLTMGTSTSHLYISTLAQKITILYELPVSFLSQLTIRTAGVVRLSASLSQKEKKIVGPPSASSLLLLVLPLWLLGPGC